MKTKILISLILLLLFGASCTKKIYVPTETVRQVTDTVRLVAQRADTLIERDTVMIMQRGDTVYRTQIRWRYRAAMRVDTVYRACIDSISVAVPYEVEKRVEVERKLTLWQRTLQAGGYVLLIMLALLLGYVGIRSWIRAKIPKI